MGKKSQRRLGKLQLEIDELTSETRTSVLMHKQAQQRTERKKSLLHRLFFLAKTSPEMVDKKVLGGYYENLFQKLQRSHQAEGITGLLLLYSSHVIHLLESSSDVLYSVIRDLKDMQQQERALLLEPKILLISHNIPSRLFQQWEYNVLNITAERLDDTLQGEPIEKIVSEFLTLFLKLGTHIQKTYKEFPNKPLSSVLDNVPELNVPQELIERVLKSNELLTPHQFLDVYDASISVIMDSEFVWPKPEHLLPETRK
ncbi:testis-expressed protein 47 isoform X2 [Stegostoma tigrinum]|uniref:testis-expressed protein 47 isoform X2 n=1 Tax=Stegostoma tigrinum TaxID=3053191 RepID=UPI00202AE8E8|nr:testis-expressed protein 47 isoform X2 [Stegostoma tigrinum]